MNKEFIKILKKLDELEGYEISIPELNIKTKIRDKVSTALLLLPLFKRMDTDDVTIKQKVLDKEKVLDIIELLKKISKQDINYIVIYGEGIEDVFQWVKKKWAGCFYEDEFFKIIKTQNEIYIPIKKGNYNNEDLKSLSSLGYSVTVYNGITSNYFVDGRSATFHIFKGVPFINFINRLGYHLEEYLFGELLYYISVEDKKLKDLLIDNMDTVFVNSLFSILKDSGFYHFR